jgi:hypothetical protein
VSHAAVISPLAGVVHVGLAEFEQTAVAGEGIQALGRGDIRLGFLLDALVAIGPLDRQAFLLEQTFVIRDQFRQPLKGRRCFQNQLLHQFLQLQISLALGWTLGARTKHVDARPTISRQAGLRGCRWETGVGKTTGGAAYMLAAKPVRKVRAYM